LEALAISVIVTLTVFVLAMRWTALDFEQIHSDSFGMVTEIAHLRWS
jgi:hypothetical protein